MKVLVANLGSTSFKYRLFDLPEGRQLARGGIDRIGQPTSHCEVEIGEHREELSREVPDHATAVGVCLNQLTNPGFGCLDDVTEVSAIGFKAVFAGRFSGVRIVNDELLDAMEELADIAPAHNPPYVRAMRELKSAFPEIPLVAALETTFHETIPAENDTYAVPYEWKQQYQIQKWGFHGASHGYIAGRIQELIPREDLRVISCHLGGSSSVCAIRNGKSIANSLGMSPQSGLPHNNRVGDFDPFALPVLMRATGRSLEDLLNDLATKSGLLGMSGLSGDMRDLEDAASKGHERAEIALNVLTSSLRHYIGGYMALLGGVDVIVFTGGIGENSVRIREAACSNMEWAGIHLSPERNQAAKGEFSIAADDSNVDLWVLPTNEEIVVARQAVAVLQKNE
ncbi:MAG: acetate/propionate family kinase [Planctomycetaceae bacterium]